MKKRISIEELSAYLDGEAKHPDKVRQHLRDSDDGARMYQALSEVSEQLRSLPKASVRPGFSGRVLASLESPRPRWSLTRSVPAWASVAAVALVVVLALLSLDGTLDSPALQRAASTPMILSPQTTALEDEEALVAEFERRIASGTESEAFLSSGLYGEAEPMEALPTDLLLALAPTDWVDSLGGLNETADYRMEMNALSRSEKVIFAQLLEDYARVEMRGPSAQEG